MNHSTSHRIVNILSFVIILSLIAGCNALPGLFNFQTTPTVAVSQVVENVSITSVVFEVSILKGMPQEPITLELLDEVTGLALNPQRFPMEETESGKYRAEINFPLESVITYRYLRGESPYKVEYTPAGQQVRYRMAYASGPLIIEDQISAWTDFEYAGPYGQVTGQVLNPATNAPYPNAMVIVGGAQTLTASDGTFKVDKLAPGLHNLTVYSMDGAFSMFQQGAVVSENATTPAVIKVNASKFVNVTFQVETPEVNINGLPIRLAGNTYSLGNTFADLEGGISVIASRAPLLSYTEDGSYTITLSLPVGFDLRYKYTVGDGLWNSEHTESGAFVTRQLIIPDHDTTIQDQVATWKSDDSEPITFLVNVPESTPEEDLVSIQFNPYGWTGPIPMWKVAENQWLFVLYGPLNMINQMEYRYCRNDQCGAADDSATIGVNGKGRPLTISGQAQTIEDDVLNWAGLTETSDLKEDITVPQEITVRDQSFITGVEITPQYSPEQQAFQYWGMNKIQSLSANSIILTPTWSVTNADIPVFEYVTGNDPLWFDTMSSIQMARQNNLLPILYPQIDNKISVELWDTTTRSSEWWNNWFDCYQTFIINFADLAAQTNTQTLILGGAQILPAFPDGKLAESSPSGVPEDAVERWLNIIELVRNRFPGTIVWAIPYPWETYTLPTELLTAVDKVYIEFSPSLDSLDTQYSAQLTENINGILDQDIYAIYSNYRKPIFLGINYPSASGMDQGCVPRGEECIAFNRVDVPDFTDAIDLQQQINIYNPIFSASSQKDWISGIVSRGFYLPAALQDASPSIYGKPTANIVGYWFSKLLGK